jgi:hypothetical protein
VVLVVLVADDLDVGRLVTLVVFLVVFVFGVFFTVFLVATVVDLLAGMITLYMSPKKKVAAHS